MTSDLDWDPSSYDNVIDDLHPFYDAKVDTISDSNFDARGNYRHRTIATHTLHGESEFFDPYEYQDLADVVDNLIDHHQPIRSCCL